jgi:hypothetical protein
MTITKILKESQVLGNGYVILKNVITKTQFIVPLYNPKKG